MEKLLKFCFNIVKGKKNTLKIAYMSALKLISFAGGMFT